MKRIPELRKLSVDHHHGLVLARHALSVDNNSTAQEVWKEVVRKYDAELNPHFIIEEKYLAPPLEALNENALIERFHADHKKIRAIILDKDNRTLSTLKIFGELLKSHIRFEERELFQTAQSRLSPDELKAVEKACRLPDEN
jgi:hemerythrin-like domain-containing protein